MKENVATTKYWIQKPDNSLFPAKPTIKRGAGPPAASQCGKGVASAWKRRNNYAIGIQLILIINRTLREAPIDFQLP